MEGLSQRQEEILREYWTVARRHHPEGVGTFEEWASAVLEINVTLDIGGRATLRDPKVDYRVEIYWVYDRTERLYSPFETRIVGETEAGLDATRDAGYFAEAYFGRLWIELEGKADEFGKSVPRRRPKVGKPLDAGFYRQVLALNEQFKREGHPAPGKAVADRMHAKPATVRTWLRRAREMEKS